MMSDPENRDEKGKKSWEELDGWDRTENTKVLDVYPKAKYGTAFEVLRATFRRDQACKVFCKGKQCKYDSDQWPEDKMAIKGIYSTWITKNILAMARPNTANMLKHDMIAQFKSDGILSVFNLELPGEHASCGPGLESSGFSYNQHHFMDNGIYCYNYGWEDWSIGSIGNVLDAVQVMQFALREGKVAVHCHAGHGRTGALITCYLIYTNRMEPWEAVYYIRTKRSRCLQTESQVQFVQQFHQHLKHLRVVFSTNNKNDPTTMEFTLSQYLMRQQKILHGEEVRTFRNIPKILCVCCETLLKLSGQRCPGDQIKNDHVRRSVSPISSSSEHSSSSQGSTRSKHRSPGTTRSARKSRRRQRREIVAYAMGLTEYDTETVEEVAQLKKSLNTDDSGYDNVGAVKNPAVVSKLLWDWLDALKEPVLPGQDLPNMLEYTNDPREGLKLLSKGTKQTVEFLFQTIVKLEPLPDVDEQSLVQRALSTLTHQNMVVEELPVCPEKGLIRRTSSSTGFMVELVASKMMFFFMHLLHLYQLEFETEKKVSQQKNISMLDGKLVLDGISENGGSGDCLKTNTQTESKVRTSCHNGGGDASMTMSQGARIKTGQRDKDSSSECSHIVSKDDDQARSIIEQSDEDNSGSSSSTTSPVKLYCTWKFKKDLEDVNT